LAAINQSIKDLYKSELCRDPDPAGPADWQRMYDSGMSIDQIKYNMQQSPEYQKAHPTTESLKGQSLAYDPSKWQIPQTPVLNRYGSYSGADFFTPSGACRIDNTPFVGSSSFPQATGKGVQSPQTYQQPMMGGYGYGNTYGGSIRWRLWLSTASNEQLRYAQLWLVCSILWCA
jgi:hypothetical protein